MYLAVPYLLAESFLEDHIFAFNSPMMKSPFSMLYVASPGISCCRADDGSSLSELQRLPPTVDSATGDSVSDCLFIHPRIRLASGPCGVAPTKDIVSC